MIVNIGSCEVTAVVSGIAAYAAPLVGGAAPVALDRLSSRVLVAILTLGLLNTFVAYLIFYSIIEKLGAARAAMLTYVIPAVGLTLGALFLGESVDMRLLTGAVMIVGSIGICSATRP